MKSGKSKPPTDIEAIFLEAEGNFDVNLHNTFITMSDLAREGHAGAKHYLGFMHYFGQGAEVDDEKALNFAQEAIKGNYPRAHNLLATMYADGRAVKKNIKLAKEHFQKAIDLGCEDALYNMGLLHFNGDDTDMPVKTALSLIERAANAGVVEAAGKLADYYIDKKNYEKAHEWAKYGYDNLHSGHCAYLIGYLIEQKLVKAPKGEKFLQWYEEGARLGYEPAIDLLNQLYDEGADVNITLTDRLEEKLDEADNFYNKENFEEALKIYEDLGEKGDTYSLAKLAGMYDAGVGVRKNKKTAHSYFEKASALGDLASRYNVACDYQDGAGVTKDVGKAVEIFEDLAYAHNYANAYTSLGAICKDGLFGDKDIKKAIFCFEKAIELGEATYAHFHLGLLYKEGSNKDLHKAYDYLLKSFQSGYDEAKLEIEQIENLLYPLDKDLFNIDVDIDKFVAQLLSRKSFDFSLLLSGPKSTGKKQFARYLASKLSIDIHFVDIVSLTSTKPFVNYGAGDIITANIEHAFLEARKARKMLLIHNFEYFFDKNRKDAGDLLTDSQKYISMIKSEAKKFEFPFVLTANESKDILDNLRDEFLFEFHFSYLNKEQKRKAFMGYFGLEAPKELDPIGGLTPGDFSQAKKKLFVIGEEKNAAKIIETLKERSERTSDGIESQDEADHYNLELVNVDQDLEKLVSSLKSSKSSEFSLILYGPPGTGKSLFLRYLAKQLGFEVLFKKASDMKSSYAGEAEKAIAQIFREAEKRKALLIIDEIDSLLVPRDDDEKKEFNAVSSVNEFLTWLQNHKYPVCATTNALERIDKAALRRFMFKINFSYISREQTALAYQNFFGKPSPKELGQVGGLTPADFATVRKKAKVLGLLDNDAQLLEMLKQEAKTKSQSKILHLDAGAQSYDLELANTSTDLVDLERNLSRPGAKVNFSIVLYGPPGTGKTQYLRYLAAQLGMEVIVKKYSDLVSKWIGESEKNIANAFKEAEDRKAFVIIDEADSLLISRADVEHQWQLSQINEMLVAMESYPYPFACTTNLLDRMDSATYRRFLFAVKFDYLKSEQIDKAMQKFFGFDATQKLRDFTRLTPAIFVNARKKAEIFGVQNENEKVIKIIEEELKLYGYQDEEKIPEKIADEVIKIGKLPLFDKPLYEHSAEVLSSAVLIKVGNAHGSGFFISTDGYILTNAHVVQDNKFVTIVLSTGREIAGEVLRQHKARDVALVKVGESGFNALPLSAEEEPKVGTELFVIGAPLDVRHQSTLTKGVISAYKTNSETGLKDIQSDAMVQGGNSGGPALDAKGNVVCVTYLATMARTERLSLGINYFIPIQDALKHLNISYV